MGFSTLIFSMVVEVAKQRRDDLVKCLQEMEMRFLRKTPTLSFGLEVNGKVGFFRARNDVDDVADEKKAAAAVAPDMAQRRAPSIPDFWTFGDYWHFAGRLGHHVVGSIWH
ncbi:hypothetical protein U1Q18_045647 [Sarracenia purpurea var. burkii]